MNLARKKDMNISDMYDFDRQKVTDEWDVACDNPESKYADQVVEMLEYLEQCKEDLLECKDDAEAEYYMHDHINNQIPASDYLMAEMWSSDRFCWNAGSRKGYFNNWEHDDTIGLMRLDLFCCFKEEAELWLNRLTDHPSFVHLKQ